MPRPSARRLSVLTAGALVASFLGATPPAAAVETYLGPITAFEGGATGQLGMQTAMGGDGTVVVGQVWPTTDGAVVVQVKRPEQPFGTPVTLRAAATGTTPSGLNLHAAPNGALAAVWNDDSGTVFRLLPAGAGEWTPARPVAGDGIYLDEGVDMDAAGRLWVVAQYGSPFVNRVQVFSPDGSTSTTTTIPLQADGLDFVTGLVVDPDGVGHVAMRRTRVTSSGEGLPCTTYAAVTTVDVTRGTGTTAAPTVLRSYTSSGTFSAGSCLIASGTALFEPELTSGPDGALTIAFAVAPTPAYDPYTIHAFHRPAGKPWPGQSETVLTGGNYIVTGLLSSGSRVVAVTQVGNGTATPDQGIVVRQPNGTWGALQLLTGPGHGGGVAAAASPGGGAVFGWHELLSPYRMQFRSLSPSGVLSAIDDIASTNQARMLEADADDLGNGVIVYTDGSGPYTGKIRPFDGSGPRLSVQVPATVKRGKTFQVSATAADAWSAPSQTPTWTFDGGSPKSGTAVTHLFTTEGKHQVRVTSNDGIGNITTVTRTVVVPDLTKPRLTKVSATQRRVKLRASEPGRLVLTFTKKGAPKKVVSKRVRAAGKIKVAVPRLADGRWKVKVVLTDAAGNKGRVVRQFLVG